MNNGLVEQCKQQSPETRQAQESRCEHISVCQINKVFGTLRRVNTLVSQMDKVLE